MFQHFSEFIEFIETLPPYSSTYGQREEQLLDAKKWIEKNNLVPTVPIVTVTGTNGKGSTVKALSEILVGHGKLVCAFTSPHLHCYTERIAYNLQSIDENTLLRLANQLATMLDLSRWNFFFILFFINLLYCKEVTLDCLILEVSIGGRLDPANIFDASLVILTQVELDHTEILGDTREEVGLEKAGLLRNSIPFICGDVNPPITVINTSQQLNCSYYQINKQFGFEVHSNQWDLWVGGERFCGINPPMLHLTSLCCAVQAVKILFPDIRLTIQYLRSQLPFFSLPGRYQQFSCGETDFVIDVSHNPSAVKALSLFLGCLPVKHTYAIFGSKDTKDISGMIDMMENMVDEWYLVPIQRRHGVSSEELAEIFEKFAIKPKIAASVEHAIKEISENATACARIVAFGSFRIAGPALTYMSDRTQEIYSSA